MAPAAHGATSEGSGFYVGTILGYEHHQINLTEGLISVARNPEHILVCRGWNINLRLI